MQKFFQLYKETLKTIFQEVEFIFLGDGGKPGKSDLPTEHSVQVNDVYYRQKMLIKTHLMNNFLPLYLKLFNK